MKLYGNDPDDFLSDREYHLVLLELGILDDDEDWELFKEQEKRFEENIKEYTLMFFGI